MVVWIGGGGGARPLSLMLVAWMALLTFFSRRLLLVQSQPPPPATEFCLVCVDGSSSLESDERLDEDLFGPDVVSCNALTQRALNLQNDTLGCNILQLSAYQAGCCTTFSEDRCPLCSSESESTTIAFPNRAVPVSQFLNDGNGNGQEQQEGGSGGGGMLVDCQTLAQVKEIQLNLVGAFLTTPGICEDTILRRSAGYCGCPGVEVECNLCQDDDDDDDDDDEGSGGRVEPIRGVHMLTGETCRDLEYHVALLSVGQCQSDTIESMLGFDPRALCCPNVERHESCALCAPETQHLISVRAVTTAQYGLKTCADLQDAATLVTSDVGCQALQQETRGLCCVDRVENGNDNDNGNGNDNDNGNGNGGLGLDDFPCLLLCPDGAPPPDLFRTDPLTGHSCRSLVLEYSQLTEFECETAAVDSGFDAVAFCCGSSDGGVLDPPPTQVGGLCTVCPTGHQLLYPERVLFNFDDHSCQTVEDSLGFVVEDPKTTDGNYSRRRCQQILDDSRATSNCECRLSPIDTMPPVPTTSPNNGGGEGSGGVASRPRLWATTLLWGVTVIVSILPLYAFFIIL